MYPNSFILVKIVVHIYLVITGFCLLIFKRSPWPIYAPMYMVVKPKNETARSDYEYEKFYYKFFHSIEIDGYELKKNGYYFYRAVALKYDWPYIKEIYDNMPDIPRPAQSHSSLAFSSKPIVQKRLEDIQIPTYVAKWLWWAADALICFGAIINFLLHDTVPSDSPLANLLISLFLAVVMQIFFVPPYLVAKLFARLTRKTSRTT